MKKLSILTLLLALSCSWVLAQTYNLTISGTVTETGTGTPIANHPVDVVLDSTFIGFSYFGTVNTNAAGVYTDVIAVPTALTQGLGWTGTRDCTPAGYLTNTFTFNPGATTITGLDFSICTNMGSSCSASFSASNAPGSMVANFTDMSSGAGVAIVGWAWDFGDGNSSTVQNPTHTYAANGVYATCLTITSASGCTSTYCDSLLINNAAISCTATLTSSFNPSGSVTYSAAGTGTGSIVSYYYDFGDGNTLSSTNASETHMYATQGTYNACVTIMFSDSCVATSCRSVTTGNGNTCQASYVWYPDSTGQYSIILVNTSIGMNLSYNWTFGDGTSSTQAYPTHTYAGPGTYVVCVTVTQQNPACTSVYCDSLTVLNKVNAPFSINVVASGATAVAPANAEMDVNIYPNPARDFVQMQIDLGENAPVSAKLLDLSGKIVTEINAGDLAAGSHSLRMNTSDLPAGMYFARITSNGKVSTHKVMIAK